MFQQKKAAAVLTAPDSLHILLNAPDHFLILQPQTSGSIFQLFLQNLIGLCVKDFPENAAAFLCFRQKQPEKISLGNHGHLGKLLFIQADHFFHRPGHLPGFCKGKPVIGKGKHRLRLLPGHTFSPILGAQIFRISSNRVFFSLIQKLHFHKSGCTRLRIHTSQHLRFPAAAAGFSVKGKGNGIKDCGFSRSRIPRDQIQAAASQLFQRKLCHSCIGPEGRYRQFAWSHICCSQIFSIISSANFFCSLFIS